jgi:SAM-dependent methyltransferase
MVDRELSERVEIICGDAAKFEFKQNSYDVAACIGASFIWGGFSGSIRAMKTAVSHQGKLIIGEPYWLKDRVPPEYAARQPDICTEIELLNMVQEEGFDVEYVVRDSDDWDVYEAGNWYALIQWIDENPGHPERQEVIDHLHRSQAEYFQYGREYLGWAIYILNPVRYR